MVHRKQTVSENIMHDLALEIMSGKYDADKMLPGENELAQTHSASRNSVRNALQALSAKGLISTQARKRSVINPQDDWNHLDTDILQWFSLLGISPALFEQLIVLRLIFEPSASALAAINATSRDLVAMEDALTMMIDGKRKNDPDLFEKGDVDFHQAVLISCDNPFLMSLNDSLKKAMTLSFKQTQQDIAHKTDHALDLHRSLFEAIRLKKSQAARRAMFDIIMCAAQKYHPSFDIEKYKDFS